MNLVECESEQGLLAADDVASDPRWAAAERIAASHNFIRSGRLSSFLLHVVRCTLEGRTEELTEQQIGVQIFSRPPGYNPGEDNIVRTTARQLRQRLALYYQEEGFADPVRIQVPRGGYVPVFQATPPPEPRLPQELPAPASAPYTAPAACPAAALSPPPAPEPPAATPAAALPSTRRAGARTLRYAAAALAGILATAAADRTILRHGAVRSAAEPLWAQLFTAGQRTLFVPGDAGLNLYNIHSGRRDPLTLSEYLNNVHPRLAMENLETKKVYPEGLFAYIPVSDLRLGSLIPQVSAFRADLYEVHGPQNLSSDALRNANVILSGAPPYNPWVEMFDQRLNFHFVFDGTDTSMRVVNLHPAAGEQPAYMYDTDPTREHGYGYLALTQSPLGSGRVLLIEGTSLIGVDAAVSFLFNQREIGPVLDRARRADGGLGDFEVLLQAPFFDLTAGDVTVVAARYYPGS